VEIFRETAWPCAIDFRKFIGSSVATKIQFYNKNNKAQCKKYFLVVEITISICVNRKLLRMKSTTKQEHNQTLKITVFSHLNVQALAPGSAT